jgi:alginate O-acetyltransferase complex protein AlgJ
MTHNSKYSSREEQALAEVGKTTVSASQKRVLAALFLAVVFFVPLYQQVADVRAYLGGTRLDICPQCYEIFGSAFKALQQVCRPPGLTMGNIFSANRRLLRDMHAYENALEDNSLAGRKIRPSIQYLMTRWLGAGNDKTYCGRGEWLFYRPDIDCVMNHGFLEKGVMARRAASGSETVSAPQPDPRPAIYAFNAELVAKGIKLILMPTPVKPVIHPEKFTAALEDHTAPVHNADYGIFIKDMEKAGIPVFDISSLLVQQRAINRIDQFLAGDTHWKPEAMELSARFLNGFIGQTVNLGTQSGAGYTAVTSNIARRGDIVAMLRLPEAGDKYGAESVTIRRIFNPDGSPWQPSADAEILVLGDSFANIYSLENMGWGANAGLVEQLSCELQRKVDRITVNDNGSWATREALARELARGNDRLAGKKVVVWQFAERELSEGDWKIIPLNVSDQGRAGASLAELPGRLPEPTARVGQGRSGIGGQAGPAASSKFIKLSPGSRLEITGVVKSITAAPRPRSVPYADHIIAARLAEVTDGTKQLGQALVYMMSMTNHVLTPAAGLRPGDRVKLVIEPWADVSAKYERINRTDLDDSELLLQEPCWGEYQQ